MSLDSVNIRVSNAENNIINSINKNNRLLGEIVDDGTTHSGHLEAIETAVESIEAKVSTEAKQDDMITELKDIDTNTGIVSGAVVAGEMRVNITSDGVGLATESTLSSVDGKISKGEDGTITGGGGGLQQVLLYGRDNTTDLHPIRITPQGDIDVEIAEYPKGQESSANSFPVVIASDQTAVNSKLIANYSGSDIEVKADMGGRLCVQVDAMRASGSETFTVADGTTGYSSSIAMGTHKFIAFYGDTDNTTNTNIFIEYSQDNVNFYRGAGDNAKIIVVSASGNFYDEEHVTPPFIRLARPNTSGGLETIELKYTRL